MRCARGLARIIAVWLILFVASSPAFAEERQLCPICLKANDPKSSYQEKGGNTLLRGALNASLGWTEIIRQPAQEAKEGGNLLVGLAKGVGQGLTRTLTGLGEIFTFWTPKLNDQYIHFAQDCPLDTTK